MTELKKTITELKEVIQSLKTQADKGTAWDATEKANLEKRLSHLNDKSSPHHSNLSEGLKFDIQDLDNLEALIGADKTQWATEKSKLEKEKKDAQEAKTQAEKDKQEEINKHNQTKQEIADKLSTDLITGLDNIVKTGGVKYKRPKKDKDGNDVKDANGSIIYEDATLDFDDKKLEALKTVLEELKNKTDLSNLDSKFKEVKDTVESSKGDKGTNPWSIGACFGSGIAVLLLAYIAFLKPNGGNSTRYKTDKEELE